MTKEELLNNGLKISEMIKANQVTADNTFPIVQNTINKQLTIEQLAEFLGILKITSDILNNSKDTSASAFLTNQLHNNIQDLKTTVDEILAEDKQSDWSVTDTSSPSYIRNKPNVLDGEDGVDGKDGVDGHSPIIVIQNGYWYIDGENTGIRAEGVDGIDGIDGTNGTDGINGNNGADSARIEYESDTFLIVDSDGVLVNPDWRNETVTSVYAYVGNQKFSIPTDTPRESYLDIEWIENPGFTKASSQIWYQGDESTLDEFSTVGTFNAYIYQGNSTDGFVITHTFSNQKIIIHKIKDGESPIIIIPTKSVLAVAADYNGVIKPEGYINTNVTFDVWQGLTQIPFFNNSSQSVYWQYGNNSMTNGTFTITDNDINITSLTDDNGLLTVNIQVYKNSTIVFQTFITIPIYKIKDGADGSYNDSVTFVPVYVGTYISGNTYVGGDTYGDAVKFVDSDTVTYYYVKRNRSTELPPYYGSEINYDTAEDPDETKPWRKMDSYRTVATELLLAQGANIGGWIFYELENGDQVLESVAKTNNISNALLNGTTGYAHFAAGNAEFNSDGTVSLANGNLNISSDGNVSISGSIESNSDGDRISIDSSTRSIKFTNTDNEDVMTLNFEHDEDVTRPAINMTYEVSSGSVVNTSLKGEEIKMSLNNDTQGYTRVTPTGFTANGGTSVSEPSIFVVAASGNTCMVRLVGLPTSSTEYPDIENYIYVTSDGTLKLKQ